jgi:hypothetical protein
MVCLNVHSVFDNNWIVLLGGFYNSAPNSPSEFRWSCASSSLPVQTESGLWQSLFILYSLSLWRSHTFASGLLFPARSLGLPACLPHGLLRYGRS